MRNDTEPDPREMIAAALEYVEREMSAGAILTGHLRRWLERHQAAPVEGAPMTVTDIEDGGP